MADSIRLLHCWLVVQVHRDTGPSLALVPWADMLNHSSVAGKESCLVYDSHTRTASLRAHQVYDEGEQVYDSYGPNLSPSQLLLDYGFVDKDNRNYAVDLPVSISLLQCNSFHSESFVL